MVIIINGTRRANSATRTPVLGHESWTILITVVSFDVKRGILFLCRTNGAGFPVSDKCKIYWVQLIDWPPSESPLTDDTNTGSSGWDTKIGYNFISVQTRNKNVENYFQHNLLYQKSWSMLNTLASQPERTGFKYRTFVAFLSLTRKFITPV
jgi:hypothetical protein